MILMESEVTMKATGVVRRIDELGRIVIPKEVRKTLRIREGENLEIYIDDQENIILKKYSFMNKLEDFAQNVADSIYTFLKIDVMIADTDKIIAASGSLKKEYLGQMVSADMTKYMSRRENMLEGFKKEIEIISNRKITGTYAFSPIIVSGDTIGMMILFSDAKTMSESDFHVAQIFTQMLSKHLED